MTAQRVKGDVGFCDFGEMSGQGGGGGKTRRQGVPLPDRPLPADAPHSSGVRRQQFFARSRPGPGAEVVTSPSGQIAVTFAGS